MPDHEIGDPRVIVQIEEWQPVITSYSIHYTKLYEVGHLQAQLLDLFLDVLAALHLRLLGGPDVITSYSIHYTKLYDVKIPYNQGRHGVHEVF